jgi:hypothetical protein
MSKEYNPSYYQANKEQLRQKSIAYYEKNKAEINKRRKEKYHANPEPRRAERKKWYLENRERALAYYAERKDHYRNKRLQREYGITLEEHTQMLKNQNECCAICQNKRPLRVDHNHSTGKVRGLLCDKCNVTIGLLDENITVTERLTAYLKQHQ